MITRDKKQELMAEYKNADKDSGSPEVQVALLTERITEITEHLKKHKKDFATRRGLTKLVAKRNSLLNYLKNKDQERYKTLINRLGLRK